LLTSTGEDKLLNIWHKPSFYLSFFFRKLVKCPTSIVISPNGKCMVIIDKSGDV
ncbi:hypothetical protein BY996DRAFT_4580750, partial [Phakopsora pachyrhizi]